MRFGVLILVWVALSSGWVRADGASVVIPSVDELATQFDHIVFGTEFQGFKPHTKIKKWAGPLRVIVEAYQETSEVDSKGVSSLKLKQKQINPVLLRYIQKHLRSLVAVTGLTTEDVKKSKRPANFIIKIVPRDQLAPIIHDDHLI